jgi:hypothetical protein
MQIAAARHATSGRQEMIDKRTRHHGYVRRTGADLPEVRGWRRPGE